jgi:MFS family permease
MSVCTWDRYSGSTQAIRGPELRSYLRLVTIAWGFGAAFFGATGGTALPELAKLLGASQFFFGLLAAAPFLGAAVQLPISWLIENTGRRKWLFIVPVTAHRLLFLMVAAIPFLLPESWRGVRLCALVATLVLSSVLAGVGGPTWMGWMADMIPAKIRGRYWAFRRRVGLVTQMLAAFVAGWFIDYSAGTRLGSSGGIAVVFAVAAVLGSTDVLLFTFIPEIPKRIAQARTTWRSLVVSPLRDRSFRQLMAYWFLLTFANAGLIGTFFQRNLREIVQMRNSWVNFVLIISPCIGWYIAVKWWGRVSDRWGNRPILVLASAAVVISPLIWCFIRPESAWIGLLIPIYGGMVWSGIDMALSSTMLRFAEGGKTSSYQAVAAIIIGLGGIFGPLVAGTLGQMLGNWQIQMGSLTFGTYHLLFLLGTGLQVLTVPLALRIEEPQARSAREVLRILYTDAGQMARVLAYGPRPGPAVPVLAMTAGGNGLTGNGRRSRWYASSQAYTGQRTGHNGSIHNGVHPTSYNDYILQLIQMAGKELEDHARRMREPAAQAI